MLNHVEMHVSGWPTWATSRTDLRNSFRGQVGRDMRRKIEVVKEKAIANTLAVSFMPEMREIASEYRITQASQAEGFFIGIRNDHELFPYIEYDTEPGHWPNATEGSRFWNWAAAHGWNERQSYEGTKFLYKQMPGTEKLPAEDRQLLRVRAGETTVRRRSDLTVFMAARAVYKKGTKGHFMLQKAWDESEPDLDAAAAKAVDDWVDKVFLKDSGMSKELKG